MKTIETTAVIDDDRKLSLQLPPDVSTGEHRVLIVLEELRAARKPWTIEDWPTHDAGLVDPNFTMRREDLYGGDGR